VKPAVSVTFDNLGEAAELGRGDWPDDRPRGEHFSVTEVLPRILELLDETGVRATFFVEGVNVELYPDALRGIARAGPEVGFHAWTHENWGDLDLAEQGAQLERARQAFGGLGFELRGMRPPGGRLGGGGTAVLREHGLAYCSPAGDAPGVLDGVAVLPFRWAQIDASFYMREEPGPPEELRRVLLDAVEDVARDGGHLSLLFHPFLSADAERLAAMRAVIEDVARRAEAGELGCAPAVEVAERLLASEDAAEPVLDEGVLQ
jgi:peptidoglycan/xylan/chitin deacetylase (PgdA/CDA1 family)